MQEIIRKDKNGTVLNVGDQVSIDLGEHGSGTGVVATCIYGSTCSFDHADKVWIKWETATPSLECNIGLTVWSESRTVTLIKRKAQPHEHAELIKAWADDPTGVVIQYHDGVHWVDTLNNNPSWRTDIQYRIKPKTQKVKKYNFSYRNKFEIIQTSIQRFTEEDFKKQFVDSGACTEYVRLDFSMQEVEIEV